MTFRVLAGNVLDSNAQAVLLTIDGTGRNLFGTVAQAFQRRWTNEFEDLVGQIRYPLRLGDAQAIHLDGDSPFRTIVVASTLHHVGVLDESQKANVVRLALSRSLELAYSHQVPMLATAVLSGGWRLPVSVALDVMRQTYERFPHKDNLDLLVHVLDASIHRGLTVDARE